MEKSSGKPPGSCQESGCFRKATRKIKTRDGLGIWLCEEHYAVWKKNR